MDPTGAAGPASEFKAARDFLLAHREDCAAAYEGFTWPRPQRFNWALDWFDAIARGNDRTALWIVEEDGGEVRLSFDALRRRSDRVANWLRAQGVRAGDRIVVMLGNQTELWETALAAMKLRAVVIPATPLLGPADLTDRIGRGEARHVIVRAADTGKFAQVPGVTPGSRSAGRTRPAGSPTRTRTPPTRASPPTGRPPPMKPCFSTSPPAPPPSPSSSSTATSLTPSGT
ncbi:hypothetical protein GCM10020000_16870 [Streptomyces olivoverticillatus]